MNIITTVKNVPLTKKLYELKRMGKCPIVKVRIVHGEPTVAILKVSEVQYYFHNTQDTQGNAMDITKDGEWYSIPFDGWNVSND